MGLATRSEHVAEEASSGQDQPGPVVGEPPDPGSNKSRAKDVDGDRDEFGLPIRNARRPAPPPDGQYSSDESYESAVEADVPIEDVLGKGHQPSRKDEEPISSEPGKTSTDLKNDLGRLDDEPKQARSAEGVGTPSPKLEAERHDDISELNDAVPPVRGLRDGQRASDPDWARRRSKKLSISEQLVLPEFLDAQIPQAGASEWSHQLAAPRNRDSKGVTKEDGEWQEMPAFASHDMYDDDGKLVARGVGESDDEAAARGGARKGYTKVNVDDDAQSASSMDENTRYLFKETSNNDKDNDNDDLSEEDEGETRDPLSQLQATKDLLTEQQRIAYVAVVRVCIVCIVNEVANIESARFTKKELRLLVESTKMWGQKMMIRLYAHMEVSTDEQLMIEQLAEHGVQPADLTPVLMQSARVKNPMAAGNRARSRSSSPSRGHTADHADRLDHASASSLDRPEKVGSPTSTPPPEYRAHDIDEFREVQTPSQLPPSESLDIDLRWTVLCDLFLLLVADSTYDARSRVLLERVAACLDISWLEICKFEKRVTEALEMQEAADKENWDENEHMEKRAKMAVKRRIMMMGVATVGGSLVIGLSAGLLAPVIGAGLAAGFTTIGIAGTSGFLAGAGGAAVITTTGVVTGGAIAGKASSRRTGPVKTFEYRPLHNNKRVNLIVTIAGWMTGKVDDVRLPFSTVDPVMGDIYSVLWEPEMLQSMGQTINILATEALTQGLQQVLGSTVLVALMASLQLPIVLTKLSYLIDNPWTVSLDRANAAGLILADSLIDRNLGARPVSLVGFSLGSRVIFACLRELADKGAVGLVQNVFLFGSPVVAKKDEYVRARSVVAGRFVNGYATNDWILGYLFRATSGGIWRIAGLARVEGVPGVENIDVTELVAGHMAYRQSMPRLLREVGWSVTSDEFTEIEDADPDNHAQRQREIIAEIDEARKMLETTPPPKKKRFGFFTRNKKLAAKKEWETYDDVVDTTQRHRSTTGTNGDIKDGKECLFDVDAIRAELAGEQIHVREIESTLPPMKIEFEKTKSSMDEQSVESLPDLRPTRSLDVPPHGRLSDGASLSSPTLAYTRAASPGHLRRSEIEPPPPTGSRRLDVVKGDRSVEAVQKPAGGASPASRHELRTSRTTPASLEHNAWLDDDPNSGKEQDITLSFE